MKFFAVKSHSDIDLAPITELRCGFCFFSILIAEYNEFTKAAKVAKYLNRRKVK
jgi:hypothetical protein